MRHLRPQHQWNLSLPAHSAQSKTSKRHGSGFPSPLASDSLPRISAAACKDAADMTLLDELVDQAAELTPAAELVRLQAVDQGLYS